MHSISKKIVYTMSILFFTTACESNEELVNDSVVYTKISDCVEQVKNDNAAFSHLKCKGVGTHALNITVQEPVYFTLGLKKGTVEALSEFEEISGELPLETGPVIEWHLRGDNPRFMIYRVSWGTDDPFTMKEYLVLSYVAGTRICPLAKVDMTENKHANEKVRELLNSKFLSVKSCPKIIENV